MKTNLSHLLLFSLLILFLACNHSTLQKYTEESPEAIEFPVGYIAQKMATNLTDTIKLYPLPEEFLENFLKTCLQYEGTHPSVATDFPKEWGVVMVERLPEGRELYQIQSYTREWIYLAITSGFGTIRILDILPVAVNLAIQSKDILESEIWTAERDMDGRFSVTKKYEWVRSLENVSQQEYDANPQNYIRSKTVIDKYIINDSYRFERIIAEDIPNYSAVLFYYKDERPENWEDVAELIQAFCEDYSIIFAVVHENFNTFPLIDYKFNFIAILRIACLTG